MLRLLSPIAFLLILPLGLAAQYGGVRDGSTEYDKRTLSSQTITLEAAVDDVYDRWDDFWDERYEVDIDRTDKDRSSIAYLAEGVSIPRVSSKTFDLYSAVDGTEQVATVSVSADFGDGDIVTRAQHPNAHSALKSILEEFRTYFYTTYFDERIAAATDELEDVRDDATDATKDAEKARRQIEKYEQKIAKLQKQIEKTKEEVGDELRLAEETERKVQQLEDRLRTLREQRRTYVQ